MQENVKLIASQLAKKCVDLVQIYITVYIPFFWAQIFSYELCFQIYVNYVHLSKQETALKGLIKVNDFYLLFFLWINCYFHWHNSQHILLQIIPCQGRQAASVTDLHSQFSLLHFHHWSQLPGSGAGAKDLDKQHRQQQICVVDYPIGPDHDTCVVPVSTNLVLSRYPSS